MNIIEIIEHKYSTLTRKQKSIADYMLSHAEDMCFVTLKELSQLAGASEMTVLKLCTLLGFGSYNEVKQAFRHAVNHRRGRSEAQEDYAIPEIHQIISDPSGLFGQVTREEYTGMVGFLQGLSIDEYLKAARMICRANRVILIGRGLAIYLAGYFQTLLTRNGIACMVVNADNSEAMQSALYFVDADTLVLPVSFLSTEQHSLITRIVQYARSKGAALLGLTDSTRAEIAGLCDMCIYASGSDHIMNDSLTTAVMAANLLSTAVSLEKNRAADAAHADAAMLNRIFEGC